VLVGLCWWGCVGVVLGLLRRGCGGLWWVCGLWWVVVGLWRGCGGVVAGLWGLKGERVEKRIRMFVLFTV
jgi:hypothetical protein